ncbi:hypothetical protein ACSBR1_026718 [Camellia fascicularis]
MKVDGESKRFHSLIWASFGSSPDPKFWLGICILPIWPFGDSLGPSPSLGRNHGIILCKSWVAQSSNTLRPRSTQADKNWSHQLSTF